MSASVMRFSIPLQRDDLKEPAENNWDYRVRCVYNTRDLKTKLNECLSAVKRVGSDFLLSDCDGFDVCFSVLTNFHNLSVDSKRSTVGMMEKALAHLVQGLDAFLEQEPASLASDEKTEWQSKMKMLLYLYCQLLELAEAAESTGGELIVGKKRGGGRKKASAVEVEDEDGGSGAGNEIVSVEGKNRAVSLIYRLLHFNLPLLFNPPVVEEEFVNLIASCLFRMLEAPYIALVKGKDLKMSIFQVLGTLNSKYNYSLSCRLKLVQGLRHFEHLALPLAEAVALFASEFYCPSMVLEVIRDLSQIDSAELARDTSATR